MGFGAVKSKVIEIDFGERSSPSTLASFV